MDDPESILQNPYYRKIVGSHREWLRHFDKYHLKKWDDLFTKNNPEAALCEAATRQVLEEFGIDMEPYDDFTNESTPDFRCYKNEMEFYAEVTCITKNNATEKSGLEEIPKAGWYNLLTTPIFQKARNKVTQCSKLNAPCLLAIGTIHSNVSHLCFDKRGANEILTGKSLIACDIDTNLGQTIGQPYATTHLQSAAFIRPAKNSDGLIEYARSPISAIMLCPFGTRPTEILGVLHPNPNYPFDRNLLPKIEFCRLTEGYQDGKLEVEWI